jgi:hypothetical protein
MSAHVAGEPTSLLTLEEFCLRNRMARVTFHKLQREGRAPAIIRLSAQLVRISVEAEREWRMRLSAPSGAEAKAAAVARAVAQKRGRTAAAASSASPLHVSKARRRVPELAE